MVQSAKRPNRLLLVELDAADLSYICRQLSDQDLEIEATADLRQALRMLRERSFDLVLAGPGISAAGCDNLIAQIRRHQRHAHLVVCPSTKSTKPGGQESRVEGEKLRAAVRHSLELARLARAEALAPSLAALNQAWNIKELLRELAGAAADLAKVGRAFAVAIDRESGEFDYASIAAADRNGQLVATSSVGEIATFQLPRLRLCLEQSPTLLEKLARGEQVTIEDLVDKVGPQGNGAKSQKLPGLLLLPVLNDSSLEALLCLQPLNRERALSAPELELLERLCRHTALAIARIRELEARREKSGEADRLARRTAELEQTVAELMQARNELESIVQMKSHLLSNVAHELRTPLVAIRGYVNMILDGRAGQINSTQREYLAIVAQNTTRLVNLISNLLHFSRFSATSGRLFLECFDMRELCEESLRLIRPRAIEKSIKIIEKIPPEPFTVTGDREKLAQVFNNLLSNAVKFTDSGGQIAVEFWRGREDEVTVKVSDTGVGIPPELLDKIFDRYYQADLSPSRNCDGVGIGLSIVHDIIRLHGGRISVASKVGEGSTFVFTLPTIRSKKCQEVKPANEQTNNFSGRR